MTARPARRPARQVAAATVAVTMVLTSVAGCADGRKGPTALPASRAKQRSVFVVVGGRESTGDGLADPLHTSWPQAVYAKRLPIGTVFVNMARADTTVAAALIEQVPLAVEQRPTIAAVWLGEGDDDVQTPPTLFGSALRTLLTKLRRQGATRVLVAFPPPRAAGSRYAAEIERASRSTGAELVALSRAAWDPHAAEGDRVAV